MAKPRYILSQADLVWPDRPFKAWRREVQLLLETLLWIRIRMDLHRFWSASPDPIWECTQIQIRIQEGENNPEN